MSGIQRRIVKLEVESDEKPLVIVVDMDGELRCYGRIITVDELEELEKTKTVALFHVVYDDQTPVYQDEDGLKGL